VLFTPTYDGACATEDAVYYLVYNLERALALAATKGQASYTVIVDIAQASAFPPLKAIKASFAVMGQHYPMRSGNILLVNGGGMIQWIWKVLEPLVDPRTREKVYLARTEIGFKIWIYDSTSSSVSPSVPVNFPINRTFFSFNSFFLLFFSL